MQTPPLPIAERLKTADPVHGRQVFMLCAGCHGIASDGTDRNGPNLYAVIGNPIAERRARYSYTAALRGIGGVWTFDRMDAWLADPRRFAPGTSMAFMGVHDPADRADLIAYLNDQGSRIPIADGAGK